MYRPLHLFGTSGHAVIAQRAGCRILADALEADLAYERDGRARSTVDFAAVLIVFGGQMLALGLLGDLQVRNFQEPQRRVPYTVAHVLRSQSQEQAVNE